MGGVRRRSSGGVVDLDLNNSNVETMFPEELRDRENQSMEEGKEKVETHNDLYFHFCSCPRKQKINGLY